MLLTAGWLSAFAGSKVVYTANIVRSLSREVTDLTLLHVSTNALCDAFNYSSEEDLLNAIDDGTVGLYAQSASGKVYTTESQAHSYGTGWWFTKSGIPCTSSNSNRVTAIKFEEGYFYITHNSAKAAEGTTYSVRNIFVQGEDTIQYLFNISFGDEESVTSDQPEYEYRLKHRTDEIDNWPLQPLTRQNEQEWQKQNYVQVVVGDKITFSMANKGDNKVYRVAYYAKDGKTTLRSLKEDPEFVLSESATMDDAGYYYCSIWYKDADDATHTIKNLRLYVDVQEDPIGTPYSWEGRVPQFSHDWKSDADYNYGVYTKPEKLHSFKKKDGTDANYYAGEWWSAFWGDNLNSTVGTDSATIYKAAQNMVEKYDEDFAYIRDYMGWPPDLSARKGYKSFVYVFGSGLKNDSESNTTQGGYQSSTSVDGGYYACVWASYYPFSRFRDDADSKWSDGDYQREAMIHEGIHAIFADLNACSKSSWFHEAGNTWLQSAMTTERSGVYGTPGYLDACPFIAPYMPIECYSGWLLDGSFGGPTADGVNYYNSAGQQVCTWRNLLGGTQYGNSFPIILGEICGKGSIPWIWRNCKRYVLQSIGELLGEYTMRQLIQEYRSRQAIFDIGGWKPGYRSVTNGDFGVTVKEEYGNGVIDKANSASDIMPCLAHVEPFKLTMYQGVYLNSEDGWMAPDTILCPGWSGSNIIPIHVDSKENTVTVEFRPEDTEMRAQLCYITPDGKNYYSQPVQCGKMVIDVTDRPANNVIFCVVCNTDYIYTGNDQRKHHYDYRIRFGKGALQLAELYTKWNLNEETLTDATYDEDAARAKQEEATAITAPEITPAPAAGAPGANGVRLLTGNCLAGQPITVQLASGISSSDVTVNIFGLSGIMADEAPLTGNQYTLPSNLQSGLYFIKFIQKNGKCDTYKVIVK